MTTVSAMRNGSQNQPEETMEAIAPTRLSFFLLIAHPISIYTVGYLIERDTSFYMYICNICLR